MLKLLILLGGILPHISSAANILVLATVPSPSHHVWIRTLTAALAARGHNITSISADVDKDKSENLHYLHLDKVYEFLRNETDNKRDFFDYGDMNQLLMTWHFNLLGLHTLNGVFISTGYRQLLAYPDDFKFDLVIYDTTCGPTLLKFVHKFNNPPILGVSPFTSVYYTSYFLGTPIYSFVPFFYRNDLQTNFISRVENFICFLSDYLIKKCIVNPRISSMTAPDFPNSPDVSLIEKEIRGVLVNIHPALGFVEPSLPNVISVGGLQIQEPKPLPEDLKVVVDNAKDGVIIFSLGTNMRSDLLGPDRLTELLEAFRQLPQYTILWKFESNTMPIEVPKNVIIRAWLPQNDILAHPNTKLFISHCGVMSVLESTWYGVPIIGFPIFMDQFSNNEYAVKSGMAIRLKIRTIKRDELKNAILKMMTIPSYRKNALERSRNFRDQPETPLERGIWWAEYFIRNPNATFMKSPAIDLNIFQRLSLDVVLFILIIPIVAMHFVVKLIRIILKNLFRKSRKQTQKRKTE